MARWYYKFKNSRSGSFLRSHKSYNKKETHNYIEVKIWNNIWSRVAKCPEGQMEMIEDAELADFE